MNARYDSNIKATYSFRKNNIVTKNKVEYNELFISEEYKEWYQLMNHYKYMYHLYHLDSTD